MGTNHVDRVEGANYTDRVELVKVQVVATLKLFVLFLLAGALLLTGALGHYALGALWGPIIAAVGVAVLGGALVRTRRFANAA